MVLVHRQTGISRERATGLMCLALLIGAIGPLLAVYFHERA